MFDLFKRDNAAPRASRGASGSRKASRVRATSSAAPSRRRLRRPVLDDETLEAIETALLTADVGVAATAHADRRICGALETRGRRGRPEGDAEGGAGRSARAARKAARRRRRAPVRDHARRRERRGQDHLDRQARQDSAGAGPFGAARRGRHVPRRGAGAARRLGRAQRRRRDRAGRRRPGRGDVRRDRRRAGRAAIDVVLADTAGRLPTQLHLMDEIRKVQRVIRKTDAAAPHETLLVLDANTGQNALAQVRAFDEALGLTGLVLTKLDGTAKGGMVAAIAREHPIPLRFIGVGEGVDDLKPFVAADFVDALVG